MLTVITATLPTRGKLFAEAAESLALQTLAPQAWYVRFDHERRGPVAVLNDLADQVETEWLYRLDDDDLLQPDHFETIRPYLEGDVDIVYSWCRVEGKLAKNAFQCEFDRNRLKHDNFIPSAACIRTKLWRRLGGYAESSSRTKHEDWDFWLRAENEGAQFRNVPIVTWTYRLGDWEHRSL